jgi:hypothetical protein
MLQVEQVIGGFWHQKVQIEVNRFTGKLACLNASRPARR